MIIQGSTLVLSVLCLSWTPSVLHDWLSCPEYLQRTLRLDDKDGAPGPPLIAKEVKRVAIIGAGTAGLAALKTFVHDTPKPDGQRWEIELFEQRHDLGGIWSVLRFRLPELMLTGTVNITGCQTTIQPAIHVSRRHHCIQNCARPDLPQQVIVLSPKVPDEMLIIAQ